MTVAMFATCLLTPIVTGPSSAAGGTTAAAATAVGSSSSLPIADDPVVAAAVAAAEAKLLRRQLAAAEKQAAAMKDVFKQRVKAFRESCRCGCVYVAMDVRIPCCCCDVM
jgi:hypothetical protein